MRFAERVAEVSRGHSSPDGMKARTVGVASRTWYLMDAERQKSQQLAFTEESRGESPKAADEGIEASVAKREYESPAVEMELVENGGGVRGPELDEGVETS